MILDWWKIQVGKYLVGVVCLECIVWWDFGRIFWKSINQGPGIHCRNRIKNPITAFFVVVAVAVPLSRVYVTVEYNIRFWTELFGLLVVYWFENCNFVSDQSFFQSNDSFVHALILNCFLLTDRVIHAIDNFKFFHTPFTLDSTGILLNYSEYNSVLHESEETDTQTPLTQSTSTTTTTAAEFIHS